VAAAPRRLLWAALALGLACALKATAWPALPILVTLIAATDSRRIAARFALTTAATTVALVTVTAPLATPGALIQNTVLFPLGLTRDQTQADSPLPGHLLAATGPAGHWAAIGLTGAAALALAVSLLVRPPAEVQAAAGRLALAFVLLFALAPASRWGYFDYPAALLGFLALQGAGTVRAARTPRVAEMVAVAPTATTSTT
jgi:hypothetical protein